MISLTPSAETQLKKVLKPNSWFRVTVSSGGCSGFNNSFSIANSVDQEDQIFSDLVVCDSGSLELLGSVTLDYTANVVENKFELRIPAATSICGCGKSFNI